MKSSEPNGFTDVFQGVSFGIEIPLPVLVYLIGKFIKQYARLQCVFKHKIFFFIDFIAENQLITSHFFIERRQKPLFSRFLPLLLYYVVSCYISLQAHFWSKGGKAHSKGLAKSCYEKYKVYNRAKWGFFMSVETERLA